MVRALNAFQLVLLIFSLVQEQDQIYQQSSLPRLFFLLFQPPFRYLIIVVFFLTFSYIIIILKLILNNTVMSQYFSKQPNTTILKYIPHLKQPHKLIKIQYPHNKIQRLDILSKAINLEHVDLSYNNIVKIDVLGGLKHLRYVNLSYNNICEVGKGIVNLVNLRELNLSYNQIVKVKGLFYVGELYKAMQGGMNIVLEGNQVLKYFGSMVSEMFQLPALEKTQPISLDISLPFSNKSKELTHQINKNQNKSQTLRKLQYSFLTAKDDQSSKVADSLLMTISAQKQLSQTGYRIDDRKNQSSDHFDRLAEIQQKFRILQTQSELKDSPKIGQQYRKICLFVKNCIQNYKNLLKACHITISNTMNNLQQFNEKFQKTLIQINQQQQLIKQMHEHIILTINQNQQIPIKFYRAWVHTYLSLKKLHDQIIKHIKILIHIFIRNRQIEEITMISPQKNQSVINTQQQANNKLQGLLFSKKKYHCSENQQCQQCLIKSEYIKQLLAENQILSKKNQQNQGKIRRLEDENQKMKKNQVFLGRNLYVRQESIIGELQVIQPCTYQNILLEQARGIEDLLKVGFHQLKAETIQQSQQTLRNTKDQKTSWKTNIPAKSPSINENVVSQFVYSSRNKQQNSSAHSKKYPYFNENPLSYKVSRKNTENSVDSTQKKSKSLLKQNQKKNSFKADQNRNHDKSKSNKSPYQPQKNQNYTNRDQLQIAEFTASQPASKELNYHQNNNKQNINSQIRNQVQAQTINDKNGIPNNYSSIISMKYQSIQLKDQQPYEKYRKYHLRNSIIEKLARKDRKPSVQRLTHAEYKSRLYCSILHPPHTNRFNKENKGHQRNGSIGENIKNQIVFRHSKSQDQKSRLQDKFSPKFKV